MCVCVAGRHAMSKVTDKLFGYFLQTERFPKVVDASIRHAF